MALVRLIRSSCDVSLIGGIGMSDNEEFMCCESLIGGIGMLDNEFMCCECHRWHWSV